MIIPGGNRTAAFDVSIIDDNLLEMNKTFELSIVTISLRRKVLLSVADSFPSRAKVYILDDDTPGKKLASWLK